MIGSMAIVAADAVGLLERGHALHVLQGALADVNAGAGRLALVTGEAGAGKTALVEKFCAEHARAATVLRGACDALFTPRPLGPIRDVAFATGPAVAELLRDEAGPYQVAEALFEEFSRERPTVLMIEDVHWADEATLDVLSVVARRIAAARVLIVLTYREEAVGGAHPLRLMLGELASGLAVARVRLEPLSPEAVAQLALPSGVDPVRLHQVTAGNPFFVTEVLASGGDEIPPTVRDAVLARAARLTPAARGLLEAVSVATPHAELWLVEALGGELDARLDECLASGMLTSADGAVSFRHELARLALEESLTAPRKLTLHRAALEALRGRGEHELARLTHHADAAGDREAVLAFAPLAGARASAVGAHREAAEHYARALRRSEGLPPADVAQLLEAWSHECYLTDQADDAIEALRRAAACYHELDDRLKEGATLARLGTILWCPGRGDEARRTAQQAVDLLEALPPGRELALAHLSLSFTRSWVTDRSTARRAAFRTLALAEGLGYPDVLVEALLSVGWCEIPAERGLAMLDRAQALATELGLEGLVAQALRARAHAALLVHGNEAARVAFEDGLTYCRRHGLELEELYALADRALFELDEGRLADAAETSTILLGRKAVSTFPRTLALTVLARVRARRGDPAVLPLLEEARALAYPTGELQRIAPVAVAAAEAAWLRGDADTVREATDDALALAVQLRAGSNVACLQSWRARAGIVEPVHPLADGPYALELAGDASAAAAAWSEMRRPYESALALAEVGSEEAMRESLESLAAIGAQAAAAVLSRRLRALGARDIPRGPRAATRGNAAGLTARESEVLALLGEGLRNAAIAQRLYLSPRTVENHVAAVLRKLGAESRGGAVAEATRLGLFQDA
jgi:DNA-binding CsgD family transcriptional regulator/tetratricopeptide (TPR) repeat protein